MCPFSLSPSDSTAALGTFRPLVSGAAFAALVSLIGAAGAGVAAASRSTLAMSLGPYISSVFTPPTVVSIQMAPSTSRMMVPSITFPFFRVTLSAAFAAIVNTAVASATTMSCISRAIFFMASVPLAV